MNGIVYFQTTSLRNLVSFYHRHGKTSLSISMNVAATAECRNKAVVNALRKKMSNFNNDKML